MVIMATELSLAASSFETDALLSPWVTAPTPLVCVGTVLLASTSIWAGTFAFEDIVGRTITGPAGADAAIIVGDDMTGGEAATGVRPIVVMSLTGDMVTLLVTEIAMG